MRLLLLTGGSRGIGRAVTEVLAAEGFTVIEFSRTAPYAHSVATDLASPLKLQSIVTDVLATIDSDELQDLLVVSNAGTLEPIGPTSKKPAGELLRNLNVNLVSPILFMSSVIARFQDTRCRKVIANISAGAAHQGVFGWSLYCAAKVGVENFMRTLAIEQELQSYPFVPINVDPGVVDTDMHGIAAAASPADFPARDRFAARRARGELPSCPQVAMAIAKFLNDPKLMPGRTYHAQAAQS